MISLHIPGEVMCSKVMCEVLCEVSQDQKYGVSSPL